MKTKNKGLIIVAVALLTMAFLLPVYAQTQNGTPIQDRDQICEPQGPATRAYGEETPVQTQEKKEGLSEIALGEAETPIQQQTQTQEQLNNCHCENEECNCENEECEQYQYQFQYQYGQGED